MNFGRFESQTDRGSTVGQAEMVGLNGADFWHGGNKTQRIGGPLEAQLDVTAGGGNYARGDWKTGVPVADKLDEFTYRRQQELTKVLKDDKAFAAVNLKHLPEIKGLVKESDAEFAAVWRKAKADYQVLRPGLDLLKADVIQAANQGLAKLKDMSLPGDERKKLTDALQPEQVLSNITSPYPTELRNALSSHKELAETNHTLSRLFDDSFMQRERYDRICRSLANGSKIMADTRTEAISVTEVAGQESESNRFARERKNIQLTVASNHMQELLEGDHPFYFDFDKPGNPRVLLDG